MDKILVSGLINIETTLNVESFPIEYNPTNFPFFGINSTVSGVGYNVAKALTTLDSDVDFMSLIGDDLAGKTVQMTLEEEGIATDYIIKGASETCQSVILYDNQGQRQIHTDLKDLQESNYPEKIFEQLIADCSIACLTNINFSRPFLKEAKKLGKTIAVDVHTVSDFEDEYNQDFMAAADILFMSDEELPCGPKEWAKKVQNKYNNEIIVIGLGAKGALLAVKEDNFMEIIPAVKTREIVNTVGAGDALFSAFIHVYNESNDPYLALKKAIVFASYKIGVSSASEGFLTAKRLNELYQKIK